MVTSHILAVGIVLLSYLLGSLSSAVITCRMLNLPDPRKQGSKNPGTTNVLRIGGKKAAIITLLGDTLKGVIPVLIAKQLGFNSLIVSLVALAAFLGHLYPIFFGFKGGKGVATAFGCMLALSWPIGLVLAITWAVNAFLFRYSSLAALVTASLAPIYTWFLTKNEYSTLAVCVMSGLLIWRHRQNISNLLNGKESKLFTRKA